MLLLNYSLRDCDDNWKQQAGSKTVWSSYRYIPCCQPRSQNNLATSHGTENCSLQKPERILIVNNTYLYKTMQHVICK